MPRNRLRQTTIVFRPGLALVYRRLIDGDERQFRDDGSRQYPFQKFDCPASNGDEVGCSRMRGGPRRDVGPMRDRDGVADRWSFEQGNCGPAMRQHGNREGLCVRDFAGSQRRQSHPGCAHRFAVALWTRDCRDAIGPEIKFRPIAKIQCFPSGRPGLLFVARLGVVDVVLTGDFAGQSVKRFFHTGTRDRR